MMKEEFVNTQFQIVDKSGHSMSFPTLESAQKFLVDFKEAVQSDGNLDRRLWLDGVRLFKYDVYELKNDE